MLSKDKTPHGIMNSLTATFIEALRDAVRRAGSQTALARSTGMQQSRISDYLSGRYSLDHITVGTLKRLFPDLCFRFNPPDDPDRNIRIEGEMEKLIIAHFRNLSPAEKTRYIMLTAANFPVDSVPKSDQSDA